MSEPQTTPADVFPYPVRLSGGGVLTLSIPGRHIQQARDAAAAALKRQADEVRRAGAALDACADGMPPSVRAGRLVRYLSSLEAWMDMRERAGRLGMRAP